MEEDNPFLPLSQGASNLLWDIIQSEGLMNDMMELPPSTPIPLLQPVCSSLPAVSDWPGDFEFKVGFDQHKDAINKSCTWVFVESEHKLFVRRASPCPIHFSVSSPVRLGTVVRAMAVYTTPRHASEAVHRCLSHSRPEIEAGMFEAEHLIRSECVGCAYVNHEGSARHSVVVPFENPPVGQSFSTYIYRFTCFGSCAGGPNRRPITLIFTLEHDNVVIGRQAVSLKICASPARDSGIVHPPPHTPTSKKGKVEVPAESHNSKPGDLYNSTKKLSSPQVPEKRKSYTIKTPDIECFHFLENMRRVYRIKKKICLLPEEWKRYINLSSEEEATPSE